MLKGGRVADSGENHYVLATQLLQILEVFGNALVPIGDFHKVFGMVNTFHHGSVSIVFSDGVTQLHTAQLAALVRLGQQEQITTLQILQGLTQGATGQHAAVAEHVQGVDQDYVQIAF